jgi:3-isopropylmalate/(R)-2-methylmalate dehydratase small subunit
MSAQPGPGTAITSAVGRGLPLRGNDIDTDRIMPARYLRVVSFEGLEHHLFEDDRLQNPAHPFDDSRYAVKGADPGGPRDDVAAILIVNQNFGCGSSREHAPQGLARFGIRAVVGESFSEIFLGNSAVLGLPCFAADPQSIDRLQTLVEQAPDTRIVARVDTGVITAGSLTFTASMPVTLRDSFLSGQWDPTAMLLDRFDEVREVANRLPYIAGF